MDEINGQDIKRGCLRSVQESEAVCGELVGYVDDGAYSCGHKDPAILSDILTEKFDHLSAWMQNNKLVNNPDKTNLLVLGPKKFDRKRNEVSITAGNFTIKPSNTAKLLGCWINQSLKWNKHLLEGKSSLVHQLTMRNNALARVSKNANLVQNS